MEPWANLRTLTLLLLPCLVPLASIESSIDATARNDLRSSTSDTHFVELCSDSVTKCRKTDKYVYCLRSHHCKLDAHWYDESYQINHCQGAFQVCASVLDECIQKIGPNECTSSGYTHNLPSSSPDSSLSPICLDYATICKNTPMFMNCLVDYGCEDPTQKSAVCEQAQSICMGTIKSCVLTHDANCKF